MNKNRAVARMLIVNLFKIDKEKFLTNNPENMLSTLIAVTILIDDDKRMEYIQENGKEIAVEMIAFLEELFELSPEDKIKEILKQKD